MPGRLQQVKISCEGGLDLRSTTQDLLSKPGFALRLKNFEPNVGGGYRRISGYEQVGSSQVPGTGRLVGTAIYNDGIIACRGTNIYFTFDKEEWIQVNKDLPHLGNIAALESAAPLPKVLEPNFYTFDTFTQGDSSGRVDLLIHDNKNKIAVLTIVGTSKESAQYRYIEIHTPGTEKCGYGIVHDDQHIIAGSPGDPSTFYVSKIADMEDFSGTLSGAYSVADPIVGLKSFRDILYIFCENSIWKAVNLNSATPQIDPVTRNIGCVDNATIQEVGGDLVFLATDGLRNLGATDRIDDVNLSTISHIINPLVTEILQRRSDYTFSSTVIKSRSQYRLFYLNEQSPQGKSRGIICSYSPNNTTGQSWEFSEIDSLPVTCISDGVIGNLEKYVHGDHTGGIYFHDQGHLFNGASIDSLYETPFFDLGDSGIRKNIHEVLLYLKTEGTANITSQIIYDFNAANIPQPLEQDLGNISSAGVIGQAIIGQFVIGSVAFPVKKYHTTGSGMTMSLRFRGPNNSFPFSIQGFSLNFTTGGRI